MSIERLRGWLATVADDGWYWFAKRLSANDTGQTGGHQAGFYVPKPFAFTLAPGLNQNGGNPRQTFAFNIVSHDQHPRPDLIYYNQLTRDECRFTGFGGSTSVLQDPESTGAVLFLAFRRGTTEAAGWLATTIDEEDLIEKTVGPTPPGAFALRLPDPQGQLVLTEFITAPEPCKPDIAELPAGWATTFPNGDALAAEAIKRARATGDPDRRILRRYRCETSLFQVVQDAHLLPAMAAVKTPADFLALARRVLNQRMSRAGGALERHLKAIFDEEGVAYCHNCTTEGTHQPDFLFPSLARYQAAPIGSPDIKMLAAKTTVKERWEQILAEADKIPSKHLFTLTEGVSIPQFERMRNANVTLVVPKDNIEKFPISIRPELMTLAGLINMVKALAP